MCRYLLYVGALCGLLRVLATLGELYILESHSVSTTNLESILVLYPFLGLPGAATAENGRTRPVGVIIAMGILLPGAGTM